MSSTRKKACLLSTKRTNESEPLATLEQRDDALARQIALERAHAEEDENDADQRAQDEQLDDANDTEAEI